MFLAIPIIPQRLFLKACLDYDQCVRDCDKQDASTPAQCVTDICNAAASAAIQTGHTALIACTNQNCGTQCQ